MKALISYLFDFKRQSKETAWFRMALYAFIFFRVFIYCYHFDILFSERNIIYHEARDVGAINNAAFFLTNHYSLFLACSFITLLVICAALGLFRRSNYISNFILWLSIVNINNFLYPSLTSGDHLLNQLLFFNIFLSAKNARNAVINDIQTALHNGALISIKIQVCLAYSLAALYKLTDAGWLQGNAVYETFQIHEYSSAFFASFPKVICTVLSYLVLAYQLLFPIIIWQRPFKIYVLSLGMIQHLIIAFGMGLFSFGWIMIICYILFLKYDYK